MVRHRLLTAASVAVALPPLVVTLGLALASILERAGGHPLTLGAPRSVAEAVAMRDGASAVRLLAADRDPNEVGLIRAGVLLDRPILASPLEAAVMVDEPAIFDLLAAGLRDIPRETLACLAVDAGARATLARLGDASHCRPGEAIEAVLSRP